MAAFKGKGAPLRRIAAVTLGVLASPTLVRAAIVDIHAAVPGHGAVTYLDLLRQVVPGLADDAKGLQVQGHLDTPLQHIAGRDEGGDPPDPIVVGLVEALPIQVGGRPRIAVLADLGQPEGQVAGTSVLALFDDSPRPRLLDAVDVAMDRDTGFDSPERLRLGPGDDALVTYSEHDNTGQTYGARLIIFARRDRWARLATLFTLADRACGWLRTETPTIRASPDPGRAYGRVAVTVRETLKRDDTDCGDAEPKPRPYTRTYRATWRWDAASRRFKADSRALERLQALDRKRF